MNNKYVSSELLKVAKLLMANITEVEGSHIRLTYDEQKETVNIEELPAKGKKQLRVWHLGVNMNVIYNILSMPLVANTISVVGRNDSYDKAVKSLEREIEKFIEETVKYRVDKGEVEDEKDGIKSVNDGIYIDERKVHYLTVTPVNTRPIEVKGKDFEFTATWNKFEIRMDYGDNPYDPSYTIIESASSASARKLYKIVSADPSVLKSVTWMKVSDWLYKNKIKARQFSSSWN